jgi:hypothetical protein
VLVFVCHLSKTTPLQAPFVTRVYCLWVLGLEFPIVALSSFSVTAVLLPGQDDMFSNRGRVTFEAVPEVNDE